MASFKITCQQLLIDIKMLVFVQQRSTKSKLADYPSSKIDVQYLAPNTAYNTSSDVF